MATTSKAQGQITLVDLSDARVLSVSLTSNLPKQQIYDPNSGSYAPNWTSTPLVITPVAYINQSPLSLNTAGLTVTWKRKEGALAEGALTTNETVANNILTVNANKLGSITSGLLTYLAYVTYVDPETNQTVNAVVDISYNINKSAVNAHTVQIDGEQVFKYDKNNTLVGAAQISLSATAAGCSITKWQYKNTSGTFVDYPTTADNANITGATLVVKPAHAVFNSNVATIKVLTNDVNVTSTITIAKIYDGPTGPTGNDAYTVILSGEARVLTASKDGACVATTFTSKVTAYKGTTKVAPTVAAPTLPTGMTFSQATANNEVTCTFTVAANATLGGADTGAFDLSVTVDGKVFVKAISWSKSKTGATGATGENAVVFSIFAPNGTLVQNGEGTILLDTAAYDGITAITTGATYQWAKFVSGSYQNVTGGTSKSLTVNGADIINICTYKCTMTYKSKAFVDVITVEDKTDSMVVSIVSTGGTVFKNSLGDSVLTCMLFANGAETDLSLSDNVGVTAPTTPSAGNFWYKVDKTAKTIVLQKYSGTAWAVATEKQKYEYKWYRLDKNGVAMDTTTPFKTGKTIYIDDKDVDSKTTFTVSVE